MDELRECIICYQQVLTGEEEDFGCKDKHVSHRLCIDKWYEYNNNMDSEIKCCFCKSVSKRKRVVKTIGLSEIIHDEEPNVKLSLYDIFYLSYFVLKSFILRFIDLYFSIVN